MLQALEYKDILADIEKKDLLSDTIGILLARPKSENANIAWLVWLPGSRMHDRYAVFGDELGAQAQSSLSANLDLVITATISDGSLLVTKFLGVG